MVCLGDLVSSTHIYRKFLNLWNLDLVRLELERLEAESDYKGYGIYRIFLCLLLQFLEDLSDRELERFIAESNAARWFCQFGLVDKTPDHSVFGRVRGRIGTSKLSKSLSKIFFNFIFRPIFAYFLVKLFEIYPDIPHNFTKKALKICQNLSSLYFEYRL